MLNGHAFCTRTYVQELSHSMATRHPASRAPRRASRHPSEGKWGQRAADDVDEQRTPLATHCLFPIEYLDIVDEIIAFEPGLSEYHDDVLWLGSM